MVGDETGSSRIAVLFITLLVALVTASTPIAAATSPAENAVSPTAAPTVEPPAATEYDGTHLAEAQEEQGAFRPVASVQSVVKALLTFTTSWLDSAASPANYPAVRALARTSTRNLVEGLPTILEADLTGDGSEDIVVRMPAFGPTVLVFVNDGKTPAHFAGHILMPDPETVQIDLPHEFYYLEGPDVQLDDLTGNGVLDVISTSFFVGASNFRLLPKAFQWHGDDFRLIFAAELVNWAGPSEYSLKPDPSGAGAQQFVLTYPHFYPDSVGIEEKLLEHPAGRQVWRWSEDAGKYVLFEETVDTERSAWEPDLVADTSERLRWLTYESEEAFRTGRYEEAVLRYEEVLRLADEDSWLPGDWETNWRAYAAFRHAESLLFQDPTQSDLQGALRSMQAVASEMEGDLLGELAQAFLKGYGDRSSPTAAARGVAAMQAVDLYSHFYHGGKGTLQYPLDAGGILYPGAGLTAYLNAHPDLAHDSSALLVSLQAIGYTAEEVTPVEDGSLRITLRLPDVPRADGNLIAWLLTDESGAWRVLLPSSSEEWPTVGRFIP